MQKLSRLVVVAIVLMLMVAAPVLAAGGAEEAEEGETHRFSYATGPWDVSQGRIPVEEQPEDPYFQYIEQTVGVVPLTQSWEWEGSTGYVQGLRLALAGGEEFGAIMPWSPALVQELVDAGRAIPLDDYLENAPNTAAIYSEEIWDAIRTQQGGQIYYIPQPSPKVTVRAGFIRQDWLDRVGLDVPTTKEELLEVYRAFRDQDANGNGDPNDEIPVSGRQLFRWFDDLFLMHGVSMFEGHPHWRWDEDEGIFESDQVSDEMFEAVKFINQLYEEGLMDVSMPAQTNADWTAKLNEGRIGHYFHLVNEVPNKSAFAFEEGGDETGEAHWAVMAHPPIVSGVGQQPYIFPNVGPPRFMMLTDAEQPERIMEWVEWGSSPEGLRYTVLGIEGLNYIETEDGDVEVTNPVPPARFTFAGGFGDVPDDLIALQQFGELKVEFMNAVWPNVEPTQDMLMPNTIYEGYTDFLPNQATMYREIVGQMITGQVEPTQANWDAYVEDWYAAGGQVVTDRATEWYRDFYGE